MACYRNLTWCAFVRRAQWAANGFHCNVFPHAVKEVYYFQISASRTSLDLNLIAARRIWSAVSSFVLSQADEFRIVTCARHSTVYVRNFIHTTNFTCFESWLHDEIVLCIISESRSFSYCLIFKEVSGGSLMTASYLFLPLQWFHRIAMTSFASKVITFYWKVSSDFIILDCHAESFARTLSRSNQQLLVFFPKYSRLVFQTYFIRR